MKGTKATAKPNDVPKEKTDKKKSKQVPKSSDNSDAVDVNVNEDNCDEEDPTKTIMKDFLVSVINLMSGLTRDKKAKVRK